MIELPEVYTLSNQINNTIVGKTIINVTANAHPHTFAWYTGDPAKYQNRLAGKKVTISYPGTGYTCGGYTEIVCDDVLLAISTPIKYHPPESTLPVKHHLLIEFDDHSFISCTVQMWGAMYCYDINRDGTVAGYQRKPTPLENGFTVDYFKNLFRNVKENTTVKGMLTTDQRIPGLGNGVLHDILYIAKIHPKTLLSQLTNNDTETIYNSIKSTLHNMTVYGGRNTEKDLYGKYGGYRTILSAKTKRKPCPICGNKIERETYLGGNIYYCPECQINKNEN